MPFSSDSLPPFHPARMATPPNLHVCECECAQHFPDAEPMRDVDPPQHSAHPYGQLLDCVVVQGLTSTSWICRECADSHAFITFRNGEYRWKS